MPHPSMRHLIACLVLACGTLPLHAQETAASAPPAFTDPEQQQAMQQARIAQAARQDALRQLATGTMLPLVQEFSRASVALVDTGRDFCSGKRSLRQMQAAWRNAETAWQPLEMLQIGPAIERRTQRRVNAWPLRATLLEPLLEERQAIDPARIETLGAAGKGFPALEYLLFGKDGTAARKSAPGAAAHCNVVQALAADIAAEARGLEQDWRAPDGGYARVLADAGMKPANPETTAYASSEQALGDVLNLLIAGIDAVKIRKLGKPLEKSEGTAALERIEAWRSGASLDLLRADLHGFERIFFGPGKNGPGLDDYLLAIEKPVLVRNVRERLDASLKALTAIRPPLQRAVVAQRAQVERLHKAVAELQHMLETQGAEAFKIEPGFNANDGD